ncbi:MAG: integration host factor subunit alpha, partial [Pseudomonadota bacterium]
TEVPISPRRVMVFKPSAILKQRINANGAAPATTAEADDTTAQTASGA